VRPSPLPGEAAGPNQPMLYRYHQVNIYGVEQVDSRAWYLVGVNQWIRHDYLGIVNPGSRPDAVGPGEKWIEVDLYEQTLAAYEGDRMVFATLVSSGLPQWATRRGLFRIWSKIYIAKMSGREGKPDYYYLEDVPWTMYFDGAIGLHGAYWHDYRHSHGCVNLPPIAAHWLYGWADPQVPEGVNSYGATGTWVWVH
jgi:lipoprotein-anchoring transpeptidase ErfK/SrfK